MERAGDDGSTRLAGYGHDRFPYFWLGEGSPIAGRLHIAFRAPDREAVDAFHAAALAAGGRDNGAPGLRPQYHPGYYGAFILDADGVNVEAVHHTFGG
jgi:catechol 2,3-dioxygenase-like lactoylglutathione lyase family enzyme